MPWRDPEYEGEFPSLGWQVVEWVERYLRVPNGPDYGKPLVLTDEQVDLLVRLYQLHPVTGQRVKRRGAVRWAKGKGKSPLLAAWCWAEFLGPVVFDGWDADGEPVGRSWHTPWVQLAACSEDQVGNTYSHLFEMARESDLLAEYGVDLGLTRVFRKGQPGRIEPVTASAGSREGQPVTAAVLDETHLWLPSNGGRRMAATIRRNVAKMGGTTFETTNADIPGEESVAESTWEAAQRGASGLLYVANEPTWWPAERPDPDDHDALARLRAAVVEVYGLSAWVDPDRIVAECLDPATTWQDASRFYGNLRIGVEADVIDVARWDRLARPVALEPGDVVALGFDGSDTDDATALVAVRYPDWTLFRLDTWEPPERPQGWRVPRGDVAAAVDEAMSRYRVVRMYADPPYWRTELDQWAAQYGDKVAVAYSTMSDVRMAAAADRFDAMVGSAALGHDGDRILRAHLAAARRQRCRGGWRPAKKDTRKIDAGVAAMLAVHALGDAVADGITDEKPPAELVIL